MNAPLLSSGTDEQSSDEMLVKDGKKKDGHQAVVNVCGGGTQTQVV
jgi:hypothetical protein